MRKVFSALLLLFLQVSACCAAAGKVPAGVIFHRETIFRSDGYGDNWCLTWAADDSQITSMCDGDWLSKGRFYHNHLYRIVGGPRGFLRQDLPGYPEFAGRAGSWFG